MNNEQHLSGISYFVESLQGEETFVRQMVELGLAIGENVEIKSIFPFGGPVVVQTDSLTVSLRKEDFQCLKLGKKL